MAQAQSAPYARCRLSTPGGPIRLFAVHPVSPHKAFNQLRRRGLWDELLSGRLLRSASARAMEANTRDRLEQVGALAADAAKSSDPVIIAGDTNLPGLSWAFSHWLDEFSDGFAEAGRGFGYSYPAQRMVWMRIDRILAGPRFRFLDVRTISPGVSNHLAVAADLELLPQRSLSLEAEKDVADSHDVARNEKVVAAQPHERPVRAPQVLEAHVATLKRKVRVPARHELVVREDDVALFTPEHHVLAAEIEHVVGDTRRPDLPQPGPRRSAVGSELDDVVLNRGAKILFEVGNQLEFQHLPADQDRDRRSAAGRRRATGYRCRSCSAGRSAPGPSERSRCGRAAGRGRRPRTADRPPSARCRSDCRA